MWGCIPIDPSQWDPFCQKDNRWQGLSNWKENGLLKRSEKEANYDTQLNNSQLSFINNNLSEMPGIGSGTV